jgi:hypothetical protein
VSVQNVSTAQCPVRGYASVELLGKGGARIEAVELRGGTEYGPPRPESYIAEPRNYLSFNFQAPATGASCWTALTMKLTMPGARDSLTVVTTSGNRGFHGCGDKLRVGSLSGPFGAVRVPG